MYYIGSVSGVTQDRSLLDEVTIDVCNLDEVTNRSFEQIA